MMSPQPRRTLPASPARRGWCPGLTRPMPTGDGLLARIHPSLGILTLPQARAVAEGARRFGNGHLDVTARANLQVRGVSEATRAPLARLLEAAGLGDRRDDGGPQRLTLTGPLAGRDPAEVIDVPALARAIEAAGLAIRGLPAKTLVAIEGRPGVATPDADLHIVAVAPGRVSIALASEHGPLEGMERDAWDAPAAVFTLLDAFARSGRRRVRDLSDADRAAVLGPITARDAAPGDVVPMPCPPAGLFGLSRNLPILAVDAPFGRCTAEALDRLRDAAGEIGADEIRLSPTRGFVVLFGVEGLRAAALAALGQDFIVAGDDPRRSVAACTGAPACASGTTPTLADAARLAEVLRPLAARGVSVHVSGCSKGCARPGPADLTLVGRDGLYDAVIGGGPGDAPTIRLPIEVALERLGRAGTIGLAAAFAPEHAGTGCGNDGRPA